MASRLLHAAPARAVTTARMAASTGPEELVVKVRRGADNGIGIEVSNANLILLQLGQPDLLVGDIIIGLNGTPLEGKYVGSVLDPAASEYDFTVSRRSAAAVPELEMALRGFGADLYRPDIDGPEVDEKTRVRVERVIAALEAVGAATAPADPTAAQLGFWKMVLCRGLSARSGLTGTAGDASCQMVAHWQALGTEDPQSQIVEIIADSLINRHSVAALKGTSRKDGDDETAAAALAAIAAAEGPPPVGATTEAYDRFELNGTPMRDPMIKLGRVTTYISESLRIVRFNSAHSAAQAGAPMAEGAGSAEAAGLEVAAYWKTTAEQAGAEIGRLASAPLDPSEVSEDDEMPLWERRRLEDLEYEADASGIP